MNKKVWLVWYKCDLGTSLWGVYGNQETAKRIADRIRNDFGYEANYTDETILD